VFHPGRRLLLALGLSAVVAACGSGATAPAGRTEARAKAAISRAFRALASGDGATVCSLTTAAGRKTLAASVPHASCEKVVALASGRLTRAQRAALASVVIRHVAVSGDQATVTGADVTARRGSLKGFIDPHSEPTHLSEQANGSWKISG
jgi:hypothetical protein